MTPSRLRIVTRKLRRQSAALLATLVLMWATGAHAKQSDLPDLGSPADAILSKSDEAQIGRAIMRQIQASGQLFEDPQIVEYVNEIGLRIAAHANDAGHHKFTFFVIDDPSLNAFALPGGFIGVHTGLIEQTRSEDELAGVLAHEVAHVTQRHIARAVHANSRQSILTTAMMLGAILAGAAGVDGDVVTAGMAAAQGSAAQAQINFTRSNEYEADRIGMASLAESGFDPDGMASFFEVISRNSASAEYQAPEFLRTHPVSTARIAEARSRARQYPPVNTTDTKNYGIARARLLVSRYEHAEEAVEYFERQDYQFMSSAQRYGLAVAYQRDAQPLKAARIYEQLVNQEPEVIAHHIGLAQSQLALEQIDEAAYTFNKAMELFPRNVPLTIHFAEALLELDQADYAHEVLLDLLNNVPPTPGQVRLIARAADEAGEIAESNYYMAEYSFMIGDLIGGITFLQRALKSPDLEEIQRARFEARIDFIREYMTEEQLQQLQRARSASRNTASKG